MDIQKQHFIRNEYAASSTAVSVAIVAKNEGDRIGACLDSLGFADEIVVVVDDASEDNTFEVAESKGCRVISRPWTGFSDQKQAAVNLAQNDWVLILDADEQVPEETGVAILDCLNRREPDIAAYGLLRRNFFHGRWIRRCGWWPDRVVRLVNMKKGRFSDHQVHERWLVTEGKTVQLDLMIDHHSFRNYSDLIEKLQSYSTLSANQLKEEDRKAYWWTPPCHGCWTFFQAYLLKLGFLEGVDGMVISLLNACGSFFKYAKLRELWIQDK